MTNITLSHIRSFFSSFCREEITDNTLMRAGVLVPLFIQNGELRVIFTQRTDEVEHHKGQISFPGGAMDKEDQTIIDTALREADEEIGLKRDFVETIGIYNDFRTPSGFCITPVVGFLERIQSFILNKNEVSEIFDVPLSFFLDSHNERVERHELFGKTRNVYCYIYGKYKIWGATAAMLRSFLIDLTDQTRWKKTL